MWTPISPWITITLGVPVRATSLLADPTAMVDSQAVLFQQCPGNLGIVYIFDLATGDINGVLTGNCAMLPAPTYNIGNVAIILPHAVVGIPGVTRAFNVANFWLDGTRTGDKVNISRIVL